ncbi:MAG TPA: cytochrome c, partial [Polyangiales bacterium]
TFMTNYCVSCHGPQLAEKNIHLDTLAGVTSAKGKVKSEVNAGAMPPRGSKAPTSAERKQLAQWIDCGPK